jgi:hypothetical protein
LRRRPIERRDSSGIAAASASDHNERAAVRHNPERLQRELIGFGWKGALYLERVRWEAAHRTSAKLKRDYGHTYAGASFLFHDPGFGRKLAILSCDATAEHLDSSGDIGGTNHHRVTARRASRPEL